MHSVFRQQRFEEYLYRYYVLERHAPICRTPLLPLPILITISSGILI